MVTALLAAASTAALAFALACAATEPPRVCSGYPIVVASNYGRLPEFIRATTKEIDVNVDGRTDLIATYTDGGSALFVNCADGFYYQPVRSAARIEARPGERGDGWVPLFIGWEENRTTIVDGRLFKFDMPPFDSEAPVDFLVEHDGRAYGLPFEYCEGLGVFAPSLRFDESIAVSEGASATVETIHLRLTSGSFTISRAAQQEYDIRDVRFTDLNADERPDAILRYEEKYGSGRTTYEGLLLNCGDASFIDAGKVSRGVRFGTAAPAIQVWRVSLCGSEARVLTADRVVDVRGVHPTERYVVEHDIYVYGATDRTFARIATLPRLDEAALEEALRDSCDADARREMRETGDSTGPR